jgi:competence protein ComEC
MLASLFLFANLGFISGLALASWQLSPWSLVLSFLILIWRPRYHKQVLILIIFACLAMWRYEVYQIESQAESLIKYNTQKVILRGQIIEEIDPGGNSQRLSFKAHYLNNKKVSGLVLVVLPKYPEYKYGSLLEMSGVLEPPQNFSEFRYDRYLARYGIYSTMSFPKVKNIGTVNNLYSFLLRVKAKAYYTINRALPEPEAGLATALLLGYKGTLDKEEKASFSCCGLSHIIAISGSHLTLLSVLAYDFLLVLGVSRRRSFYPVVIFLWLYTILTGLQSSALRSAVMSTLVLWGEKNGRRDTGGRLLVFAASLMLLANPFLLRDDLGFQLSFLAMVALIYFCPLGEKIFGRGEVKGILIMTVASQLLTWPISAYNFGIFSVIAPLANLLVVWIFAWLLPALLLATGLAIFWPVLQVLWFAPSYFMLHYVVWAGNFLASWPRACLNLEITWQAVIIYYIILILAYLLLSRRLKH